MSDPHEKTSHRRKALREHRVRVVDPFYDARLLELLAGTNDENQSHRFPPIVIEGEGEH